MSEDQKKINHILKFPRTGNTTTYTALISIKQHLTEKAEMTDQLLSSTYQ